jgi:hypothetical protein
MEGDQDHDRARGKAEGAVEEGQGSGSIVGGGRYEDVRWAQTRDGPWLDWWRPP